MFALGSDCLFLCSSVAHLLHNKSETAHYLTFCFDYIGIALYGYGQGMMTFYCSGNVLFYKTVGSHFHWLNGVFASSCTIGNTLARTLYRKPCFMKKCLQVIPCGMGFLCTQIPILFRIYECWIERICTGKANLFHVVHWVFAIVNGVLFSFHQPERAYPGRFDIWGHGHQWFHIGVIVATLFILYASYVDLFTIPSDVLMMAQPNMRSMLCSFCSVVLINLGIIIIFYYVYRKYTVKWYKQP